MEFELGLGDLDLGDAGFRSSFDILTAFGGCFTFGGFALTLVGTDRPFEVIHDLREIVDPFLDDAEDIPLRGVSGERFGVSSEVLQHCAESRQRLHGVDLTCLDTLDGLLQRYDVDESVGGVKLLRVHSDLVALQQEDVFHLGDLGLDVHSVLLWLGCVEARIVVTDYIRNDLVDEAFLPDLVEVREELDESAESDGAESRVACANRPCGVGRVVVEFLDRFLGDAPFLQAAMELCDKRVGLRAVADTLHHLSDHHVPR